MRFTRTAMDRRTLLRGAGVALGLPLLEAMTPTLARAKELTNTRFQVFYLPNGMVMQDFVPKQTGVGYEMTPILKPLEPFRDRFTVISGLASKQGTAMGDGPGDHGRSCAAYLTATHPKKTEGYDIQAGVSVDQLVARQLGRDTTLASLELGIDPPSSLGSCDNGYSCTYSNTLAWRTPTTPLPPEVRPGRSSSASSAASTWVRIPPSAAARNSTRRASSTECSTKPADSAPNWEEPTNTKSTTT